MNLQEQINRIQEMMGINEESIPAQVRRRMRFSEDEIVGELKNWVMRSYEGGRKDFTLDKAFDEVTYYIINPATDSDEGYDDELIKKVKDYLIGRYGKEMDDLYESLYGGENDQNTYCFIKHSERYGGLQSRGFSDCVKGWHEFLSKYGYWLPHLDWVSIKNELDSLPAGKTMLLAKPLEKHSYHYYFSIVKAKDR
jgi:hypothetical protein